MSALDVFWTWPPVTRSMVLISFPISVLVHGKLLAADYIAYEPSLIYAHLPPEIWRIPTSMLLTGGSFMLLLDTYMLYKYGSSLEKESPRFSELGSFFVYIIFNVVVIIALAGHYLGGYFFLQPLLLSLVYTFCQDNPDQQMTIFVISFSARYMPYAMLFMTFISRGPPGVWFQVTGLLSAHLYDFLTRIWPTFGGGTNVVKTPVFVKRWFGSGGDRPAPEARGFGTSYGAPSAQPPPREGWSNQRGPGRRLGGS